MKHKLLAAAGLAALMALPTAASAQDYDSGWYLRGNVGAGVFDSADFSGDLVGDVEGEGNFAPSLGIGYEFDNNWRVELDGTTLWNDTAKIQQLPSTSSDFRTYSAMLNAIYDFDDFGRWEPYLGAGIGFVRAQLSAQTHDFPSEDGGVASAVPVTNAACSPICDFRDDDSGLGYQLIAGLGYDISENLTWDTHYKYMGMSDFDFDGTRGTIGSTATSAIATQMEDVEMHFLGTGIRYRFGAAAPVREIVSMPDPVASFRCWDGEMVFNASQCSIEPQPEPAQPTISCWDGSMVFDRASCPAEPEPVQTFECWDGSYVTDSVANCPAQPAPQASICGQEFVSQIIYYEFNKPQSPETLSQMQNILNISDQCEVGSINLVGHTDTVGAASYNQTLSERRAANVKTELVRLGVPSQIISTSGQGEKALFVPTADNVKEALNRRVEVTIQLNSVVPNY